MAVSSWSVGRSSLGGGFGRDRRVGMVGWELCREWVRVESLVALYAKAPIVIVSVSGFR